MPQSDLSATFAALAHSTRRAVLARLKAGDATVTQLALPFSLSLPGFSKHLKVLERAGLITRRRNAQTRPCVLRTRALQDAADWLKETIHEAKHALPGADRKSHRYSAATPERAMNLKKENHAPDSMENPMLSPLMIIINGTTRVRESDIPEFIRSTTACDAETIKERGCLYYYTGQDLADPKLFHSSEGWTDQAALDAHLVSPHFKLAMREVAMTLEAVTLKRYSVSGGTDLSDLVPKS